MMVSESVSSKRKGGRVFHQLRFGGTRQNHSQEQEQEQEQGKKRAPSRSPRPFRTVFPVQTSSSFTSSKERERERESNAFWCFHERKKRVMTMESYVDFVSPPLFKKETHQQKKERKGRPKKKRERGKKQTDILKP